MQQVDLKPTELGYVTATDVNSKTFYVQLCKFSNQELEKFNADVNEYCRRLVGSQTRVQDPKVNEIYCAKYSLDGNWYRCMMNSVSDDKKTCDVSFVDYGNREMVKLGDVMPVDFQANPFLSRQPFGITCGYPQGEQFDAQKTDHLFDSLQQNYLLIKIISRPSHSFCQVDIPMLAYNIPFWHLFYPELRERSKHRVKDPVSENTVETTES